MRTKEPQALPSGDAPGCGPRRALAALWVAVSLSAAFATASADGVPPPDPDLSTTDMRRVGPFRLRPLLLLKDVGYDDNVLFEEQQPHGDTTATLGASLDALLRGGHRGGLRM